MLQKNCVLGFLSVLYAELQFFFITIKGLEMHLHFHVA